MTVFAFPARLLVKIVKSLCLLDQVREKELGDTFGVFGSSGSQGLQEDHELFEVNAVVLVPSGTCDMYKDLNIEKPWLVRSGRLSNLFQ